EPARRIATRLEDAAVLLTAMQEQVVRAHVAHVVLRTDFPAKELRVEAQGRIGIAGRELMPAEVAAAGGRGAVGRRARFIDGELGTLRVGEDGELAAIRDAAHVLRDLGA